MCNFYFPPSSLFVVVLTYLHYKRVLSYIRSRPALYMPAIDIGNLCARRYIVLYLINRRRYYWVVYFFIFLLFLRLVATICGIILNLTYFFSRYISVFCAYIFLCTTYTNLYKGPTRNLIIYLQI